MYSADRAINNINARAGPNPSLRVLFYKLAGLLHIPIRVVFVFDGPNRPEYKRNTRVITHGHPLTASFQQLIRDFGYHWHTVCTFSQAPGEADTELGLLASEGYIDAVQTTDSDIFLFGAPTVIYVPQKKTDGPNITMYTSEDLFTNPSISLTRGGMLLIALLCGGDYNEGITGCGLKSAHAVARGDLGDALLHKALCSTTLTNGFLEFVLSWKEQLCLEFAEDPRGLLGRKWAIAATIAQSQ
ncbi:PIN domain-like protein [Mycena maculata]|uniref:PIN domain-like protein n=1 Tax=Mycena maculata TaxID=230809 RepID=A0AAD7KEF4_9AGAR|nr:PIN domain-like protein [Mycena maculata]